MAPTYHSSADRSQKPTDDGSAPMALRIGRIEGSLDALEARVGRHEDFVGEKLATIDTKLDLAIARQDQSTAIVRVGRWVLTLLASASGWIAFLKTH